jgi:hypothetical protein
MGDIRPYRLRSARRFSTESVMPATKTLACLLVAVLLLTPNWAFARTTFILDIPHDEVSVRGAVGDLPESLEHRGLLWLMKNLATADRSQKSEGVEFPYCFKHLSREQLRKKLGTPVEFKEEHYALPCVASWLVNASLPSGVKAKDIDFEFYELKGVGGVQVDLTPQGKVVTEGIVYLKTDDKFVPLKKKEDISKRLEWEARKLRELKNWLSIPEDVAKNDQGGFALFQETKPTSPAPLTGPHDPRVRVQRDYGEMGQE